MPDKFHSSRTRLRWAKENIADFKKQSSAFFARIPYARVAELDDDRVYEIHKVRVTEKLPDSLARHSVQTLEHLRSALDMAAYAVGLSAGVATDAIHFPFCRSATDIKGRVNSACKDFPDEIKTLFAHFQPYCGGDDLLWALNELCKPSKHRFITPHIFVKAAMTTRYAITAGESFISHKWDGDKNEMIIGGVKPGCQFNYNFDVTFDVAFDEVEVVKGQPVSGILDALLGKVTRIVDATEAEGRRIGLTF
jgi:hypothetical protein